MKEITITVPDGKKAEWVNGVLTLIDEEVKGNRPVEERIKTIEDACEALGDDHTFVKAYKGYVSHIHQHDMNDYDLVAYLQLRIIASALNEGWEPQFTEEEGRWYPWLTLWTEEELSEKTEGWKKDHALCTFVGSSTIGSLCGLTCSGSYDAGASSDEGYSARLAVKSKELATYFGKQFIEIWTDFVGPFNRKDTEE